MFKRMQGMYVERVAKKAGQSQTAKRLWVLGGRRVWTLFYGSGPQTNNAQTE